MQKSPQRQKESRDQMTKEDDDHISKVMDDVLVKILSLLLYRDAVRTASVSRRWRDVVQTQLPNLTFFMSETGYRTSRGTPSEQRVQSMERTLRRRCGEGSRDVKSLSLLFRKDVPMECRYAREFIALANAHKLRLLVDYDTKSPEEEDGGAWYLELPPATTELRVVSDSFSVRPPHIHGSGVGTLRSLSLHGFTVLRQDFLLVELPSLEDLHIANCTITASVHITSDNMPRLRQLDITDVAVMSKDTKAEINVVVDELRTLRVSCYRISKTKPSDDGMLLPRLRFRASFTAYSSFRLRAPKLRVFDWRCCYADEICIENVGHLWNVVVELAAGQKQRQFDDEELSYVTVDQRDKLMRDILQGLMSRLRPLDWEDAKRRCVLRDDRWLCFDITKAYGVTQ